MTEPCQGPDPHPRKPRFAVPAGAIDSHFHLFGPLSRYAMVDDREYTPPPATPEQARHLFDTLGITRAVVIQPSIYGEDNRAQLEGAAELGIPFRAVVVAPHATPDREMADLHEQGARALRFILAHPGGLPVDDLERSAARMKEMGWHIQLLAKGPQLVELEPRIARLACPAVIDHIGMIRPADGVQQPRVSGGVAIAARGALGQAFGRLPAVGGTAALPRSRSLCAGARRRRPGPDRLGERLAACLHQGPDAEYDRLLDLLVEWVPDETVRRRILVDNPARLYGF